MRIRTSSLNLDVPLVDPDSEGSEGHRRSKDRSNSKSSQRSNNSRSNSKTETTAETDVYDTESDTAKLIDSSFSPTAKAEKPSPSSSSANGICHYLTSNWTEDGIGVFLAFLLFLGSMVISFTGSDLGKGYSWQASWPLGAILIGLLVIVAAHYVLNKQLNLSSYFSVLLIAVAARATGDYADMSKSGLGPPLWAIIFGICCRLAGLEFGKTIFSGEFFVKIGVTLLCMDYTSIVSIGLPGLMIAWGDTLIVLTLGILICTQLFQFSVSDGVVLAGATSICGSSAATALSSSVHPPSAAADDKVCKTIIAIMGVFNAPLMPLMPLLRTAGHVNPSVVGAWIGGAIDSTGQVAASAQMGGNVVLKTAIIVKMAQNILIGPLCVFFTGYFQKSFQPSILLSKFPLFVGGFLVTSAVATAVLYGGGASGADGNIGYDHLKDLLISNSWVISEWMTLIGFACIGLEIDLSKFLWASDGDSLHARVLLAYLLIQSIDLATTFGWSFLMFQHRRVSDN